MNLRVTILGSGSEDKYSQKLEENIRCAIEEMSLKVDIEHVTNKEEIAKFAVTDTPALFINDEFISSDQSLSCEEIKRKIQEILDQK